MKTTLMAALALAALTSTALAGEMHELSDVQMDQVTAGSCGVGSQCLVGAVDRAFAEPIGQSAGIHDTTSIDGEDTFISIGFAGSTPPSGGGGGGLFVVGDTVLQRGGAGQGGGCVLSPCGP